MTDIEIRTQVFHINEPKLPLYNCSAQVEASKYFRQAYYQVSNELKDECLHGGPGLDALRSSLYRISNVLDMSSDIDNVLIHGEKLDIPEMPCVIRKIETYISIEDRFEKVMASNFSKSTNKQFKTHFLRITDFEFYQLGTMTLKQLLESSAGLLKWKYRCDNQDADTITVK